MAAIIAVGGAAVAAAGPSPGIAAPGHNTSTAVGNMSRPRVGHTATLLGTGKVLIVGGDQSLDPPGNGAAELYDPATRAFSLTGSLAVTRDDPATVLLSDGRVLVVGGVTRRGVPGRAAVPTPTAEVYSPATGRWSPAGTMDTPRSHPAAVLLLDGRVLVVGATTTALPWRAPRSGTPRRVPSA